MFEEVLRTVTSGEEGSNLVFDIIQGRQFEFEIIDSPSAEELFSYFSKGNRTRCHDRLVLFYLSLFFRKYSLRGSQYELPHPSLYFSTWLSGTFECTIFSSVPPFFRVKVNSIIELG